MDPLGPWQIQNLLRADCWRVLGVETGAPGELRGDNKAGSASISERASQESFLQHHRRTF